MIQKWKRFCRGMSLAFVIVLSAMPCFASAKENKCEVTLPVQIETMGDPAPTKEVFEVSLTCTDLNAPMPEIITQTLEGAGEILFGSINYTLPEDYHYVITQKKGTTAHWIYDQAVYEVTVRIVNDEDGELVSEVWAVKNGSLEKCEKITFVNHYEAPAVPSVPTNTPQTGDSSSIRFYAGVMAASLFSMLMILWMGSRHFKRMK